MTFFSLTEATAVVAGLNRIYNTPQSAQPINLRPFLKHSLQVGNARGQKIHWAAQITNCQLKIHRGVVRPSAHAGSHAGQTELHQAEDKEKQPKKQRTVKESNKDQEHENTNQKANRKSSQQPRDMTRTTVDRTSKGPQNLLDKREPLT